MQVLNVLGIREVIGDQSALGLGFGTLSLATGWLLRLVRRPRNDISAPVRPKRSLTFSDYRSGLNLRQREIREALPGAVGDRLMLLQAELSAVEDRLTNFADSFFALQSELAQASSALLSMKSAASRSEIIGARAALGTGYTAPAEEILARTAESGGDIAQTAEAHYRLGRLALANIDFGKALSHLRLASEIAPHDFRVNASLAELIDIIVSLVDSEPLPPATLQVLEEVLLLQGRPEIAEQLYQRALAFHEVAYGPVHPQTVDSLGSLASLLRRQHKYDAAEPLYQGMLAVVQRSRGHGCLEAAAILDTLASVYEAQGKRECVWRSLRRALMIKEAALGSNHPDVIEAVSRLAKLSCRHGRLSEAELLYRRLLGVLERTFGSDHSNVVITVTELAAVCDLAGHYEEAEALYRRALSIKERSVCADHLSCAGILRSLAEVCRKQGKNRMAESLRWRAQAISDDALGREKADITYAHGTVWNSGRPQPQAAAVPTATTPGRISERINGQTHKDTQPG